MLSLCVKIKLFVSNNGRQQFATQIVHHPAKAIRWQVWTALLVQVLLRFAAHLSQWAHSFTRLFAVVRAALWERLDALGLLRSYGTAGGSFKLPGAAQQAWLPGFRPFLT